MVRSESDGPIEGGGAFLGIESAALARIEASPSGAEDSLSPALILAVRTFAAGTGLEETLAKAELHHPSESERARLATKGRVLFEHCLERRSEVCVVGFLEHRLSVQPAETGFVAEMIGWLTREACGLSGEAHDLACIMIASGVEMLGEQLQ